jgi:alpha amylase-like protein
MPHPLVYEINTRCWLRGLSEAGGRRITLDSVPDSEVARWLQFGFTHIWLMGVWTTGPLSRAVAARDPSLRTFGLSEIAGSPYAVAEYRVPENLGGEAGLQEFRRRLHRRGLKLLLDFVPNHVGLDHPWLNHYPDRLVQALADAPGTFVHDTAGGTRRFAHGRDPNFPPWIDTAQLDYRVPEVQDAMRAELRAMADRCDGVRCDMAMLVLNEVFARTWAEFPGHGRKAAFGIPEFWETAIRELKRVYPDFLFLAEVYWGLESRLQALGFDYTYDKGLYDELIGRNSAGAQKHLMAAARPWLERSVHFLENHDEARVATLLSFPEHRAAALLTLALPGMRLLHDGQLTGARVKVPVQLVGRPAEMPDPEIANLYEHWLPILKSAVGRGQGTVLQPREARPGDSTWQNLVPILWPAGAEEFTLAVVNLAPRRSEARVDLNLPGLAKCDWAARDLLGTESSRHSGSELAAHGLVLDLPAQDVWLFQFAPTK